MDNAVEIKNISKGFENMEVINNLSLNIPKSEVYSILEANSAGKNTVINMLVTLLKADKDSITVFNLDVIKKSEKVRKLIGLTE